MYSPASGSCLPSRPAVPDSNNAKTFQTFYNFKVFQNFNKESFINVDNFSSLEELTYFIEKIDSNKELYERMVHSPIFTNNEIPKQFLPETVLKWMESYILCLM